MYFCFAHFAKIICNFVYDDGECSFTETELGMTETVVKCHIFSVTFIADMAASSSQRGNGSTSPPETVLSKSNCFPETEITSQEAQENGMLLGGGGGGDMCTQRRTGGSDDDTP